MKNKRYFLTAACVLATSQHVLAFTQGDIIVRAGVASVNPNDASSNLFVDGGDLGTNVTVGSNAQLGLTFAYFLTDKINIEVLAATPFTHDVNFGTGGRLGEVTHLPPTVSINYYVNDPSRAFQPYLGAGINYTVFFDEKFTSENSAAGLDNLSLSNSFGLAAQIGADFKINDTWFVNAALRWIDIGSDASFTSNGASGSVADIEIDPWVYSISAGYRL